MAKFLIGIDEVGRGPLAGPVAVGALLATHSVLRQYRSIKESKQLSPSAREKWAARMRAHMQERPEELRYAVGFVSAPVIDKIGIVPAIRRALASALGRLRVDPADVLVLLDGGLYAPSIYMRQRTIVRGDASETAIAMASVVAKVARDARMVRLAGKYPEYGFERHVGYGTAAHIAAIRMHGLSPEHRRSFCGAFIA